MKLPTAPRTHEKLGHLIGCSPIMQQVFKQLKKGGYIIAKENAEKGK